MPGPVQLCLLTVHAACGEYLSPVTPTVKSPGRFWVQGAVLTTRPWSSRLVIVSTR